MRVGVFGLHEKQAARLEPPAGVEVVYLGGRHHGLRAGARLDRIYVVARFAGHKEQSVIVARYGRERVRIIAGGPGALRSELARLSENGNSS